jgi:uncharacterized membrane protein
VLTATIGAFAALIVLAALALGRQVGGDRSLLLERSSLEDPLRVVDEMFASGQIDLKDYQARRAQLRKFEQR